MILGDLVEGDYVRTADFFEFTNNHVQVQHSILWTTENVMPVKVHLRVLVSNFVAIIFHSGNMFEFKFDG